MFFERKTTDGAWWLGLLFPIGAIFLFLSTLAIFGVTVSFYILGVVYAVFSVYPMLVFFKMKNPGYLIQSVFMISVALVLFSAPPAIERSGPVRITPVLLLFMYISLMMLFYQTINRKNKWRGMELLELAGMPVEGSGSGYTSRPRPAGQVKMSKTEIARFTDFVTRELVSIVFIEEDSLFFVPVIGFSEYAYMLGLKKDYIEETWVSLDAEGKLSVHISEKDYLRYKIDLDFDRLCESLGEVFSEFIQLSNQGQEERIIEKMNALRLPIFS
jgi:hypothetical protein